MSKDIEKVDAVEDGVVDEIEQLAKNRKKAHGQTGPKTERGKNRSKWNGLQHGRFAKSILLPFENESLFREHMQNVRQALLPTHYVEEQLVDEYAHALWRIQRQENRKAYERDRILEKLTPSMMANMLGLSSEYCAAAPDYLTNLKKKIPKAQALLAGMAYEQYLKLMEQAKGISNFNLVWRQFPDLFIALGAYIDRLDSMRPLFTAGQKDLDLAWQQHPGEIVEHLGHLSKELYYMANFNEFKPQIRLFMESWYFAQDYELRRLEREDGGLNTERKRAITLLDKLMQLRKTQYAFWVATPKQLITGGFVPGKEINFRKDNKDEEEGDH